MFLKDSESNSLMIVHPKFRRGYKKHHKEWIARYRDFMAVCAAMDIPLFLHTRPEFTNNTNDANDTNNTNDTMEELNAAAGDLRLVYQDRKELDLWIRDFGALTWHNDNSQKLVQFTYDPTYLKDAPELRSSANIKYPETFPEIDKIDITLDGGSIDFYKNYMLSTDKIWELNPALDKDKLLRKLKPYGVEDIIIFPQEVDDTTGHIDGFLKVVKDKYILVNDYAQMNDYTENKKLQDFTAKIKKIIKERLSDAEIIDWPVHYYSNVKVDGMVSVAGNYVNFVSVGNNFILPAYSNDETLDERSRAKLSDMENFCKDKLLALGAEKVALVASDVIANYGGSWHCLTLNCKV